MDGFSRTKRHFVCKRCGKKATDLQGGDRIYSKKHDCIIESENVDLCNRCFKLTRKEEKNVQFLQMAIQEGVLDKDDVEAFKKFQTDKVFKKEILEKCGIIKVNEEKRAKRLLK